MADRVSASITIGGTLEPTAFAELVDLIAAEGLSTEWDGPTFDAEHRTIGEPLSLYAHEVAWGYFDALETWLGQNAAPFARWSGGYGSEWGAERLVHTGDGKPISYAVTEDDVVVVDRTTIERLGAMEAVYAHFDAAEFVVPPLVVAGDPLHPPPTAASVDPAEWGVDHVQ